MIQKTPVLCMALALSAALACAQGPGMPPDPQMMVQRRVNMLSSQLNLTDAQKASATTILTNAATAAQGLQTSLQTNRQAIASAVKSNNTAAIDQLSVTAGTLDGQLTAINSKAEAAFYAILTADQKTTFDSMPHGGPGGPMGPPPGGPGGTRMRRPGGQ